jgi:hypothetical protein
VTEASCPFCGHALSDAFRESPRPIALTQRLSRAARYALGTGTLSLAAACGSASGIFPLLDAGQARESGEAGESGGAGERDASGGDDSGFDAATAPDVQQSAAPPYGGFPILEAGPVETGPPEDAGFEDVAVTVPYGLPP